MAADQPGERRLPLSAAPRSPRPVPSPSAGAADLARRTVQAAFPLRAPIDGSRIPLTSREAAGAIGTRQRSPMPERPPMAPAATRPGTPPLDRRPVPAPAARPSGPLAGPAPAPGSTALERLAARVASTAAASRPGSTPSPAARPPAPARPSPASPRPALPIQAATTPLPTRSDIESTVDHVAYERFASGIRALLGFDLTQYKRPQVWRRANSFAKQKGFHTCDELVVACRGDAELRTALRDMITINVSEFFRNPEAWETLRTAILPEMTRLGRPIRFWSAGCSLGYEPYTFAMMVKESGSGAAVRITATDLDETILAQARASAYAEHQMVGVSSARRGRFFEQKGALWVVKPELRSLVQWQRQDLLRDPFPVDMDLIACRNVVIYFTDEAKDGLYGRFADALRPGGVLFIGATEAISNPRAFGLQTIVSGIYRKVG